jgi:hypothetical protein
MALSVCSHCQQGLVFVSSPILKVKIQVGKEGFFTRGQKTSTKTALSSSIASLSANSRERPASRDNQRQFGVLKYLMTSIQAEANAPGPTNFKFEKHTDGGNQVWL